MQYQVLTNNGKALQAKVEAGESTLTLTRMVVGNGTSTKVEEYADANRLNAERHSMIITRKEQSGNACVVKAGLTSDAVDDGFTATELGLYAKDGDTEILYAVSLFKEGKYIPGKKESTAIDLDFTMTIAFSADSEVTVAIPADQDSIVKLVQNNAAQSVGAADAAKASESNAAAAADRAAADAQNASISEAHAKASEKAAKETADSIAASTAADAKTATDQAKAAADSARDAANSKSTAEELYRRWCVDIVGPPAASMAEADLFVAPGSAAMAAMGR